LTIQNFSQSGGVFNASADNLNVTGNFTNTSGTFNPNGGTVTFINNSGTIAAGNVTFSNVIFDQNNGSSNASIISQSFTATGNLTIQSSFYNNGYGQVRVYGSNNPSITVGGNLVIPSSNYIILGSGDNSQKFTINLGGNFVMANAAGNMYVNLNFMGTGTQTINQTAGIISPTYSIWTAHKLSGTISPASTNSTIGNWAVTDADYAGTFFANGSDAITFVNFNQTAGTFTAPAGNFLTIQNFSQSGGVFNASADNLNVTGNFTNTSGTFNPNGGTVNFLANNSGTIAANNLTFNNVLFDVQTGQRGNEYISQNFTIAGNLTVQSSVYNNGYGQLAIYGSNNPSITVGGNLNIPSGNWLTLGSGDNSQKFTINLGGNFVMANSVAYMYANLNFMGTGTQTISRTAGTINANSIWTAHKPLGVISPDAADSIIGNWSVMDADYAATFAQNGSDVITFVNFNQTAGTYNSPIGNFITIQNFNQSGGTFNAPTDNLNITGNFTYTSGTFNPNGGTVNFLANNNGTIAANNVTFNNVLFDVQTGQRGNEYISQNFTVSGNLTFQSSVYNNGYGQLAIYGSNNPSITVGGNLIMPSSNWLTLGSPSDNSLNFNINLGGNFVMANPVAYMRVNLNFMGTGTQTISRTAGTTDSGAWTVNKTDSPVTLISAFGGMTSMSVNSGTLYLNGNGFTPSALTVNNNGVLELNGTETLNASPSLNNNAMVEYVGDGNSGNLAIKNFPYVNLEINDTNINKRTFTLPTILTISGDLDLFSGTLDATSANYNINIAGNLNNTGGNFNTRLNTVTFNGTSGSTQAISGDNTFYNLTFPDDSSRSIQFSGYSTQTITGAWNSVGSAGQLISLGLKSGDSGVWNINPHSWNVSYVDVSNSINLGSSPINPANYSEASLTSNNINWFGIGSVGAAITNVNPTGFDVVWQNSFSGASAINVYISTLANANCANATYPTNPNYSVDPSLTSQIVTDRLVNSRYCAEVVGTGGSGNFTAVYSSPVYTYANIPAAPTLGTVSSSSMPIVIIPNSNPATTTYLIKVVNGSHTNYLTTTGALSATPIWDTYQNFGGANGLVSNGLNPSTQYIYSVAARNGDNLPTSFSSISSAQTLGVVVSGHVYISRDQSRNVGAGVSVAVTDNGGANIYTGVTNSSGAFSINAIVKPDDTLGVFVNTNANQANLITKVADSVSNISNLALYTSDIVLQSQGSEILTNSDLAQVSTCSVCGGYLHLAIPSTDQVNFDNSYTVLIANGSTYQPNGEIGSIGNIEIDGTLNLQNNMVNIVGNWDSSNGTLIQNGSTINFEGSYGTQTIKTDGQGLGSISFLNNGTRQIENNTTIDGTFNLSGGVLDLSSYNPDLTIKSNVVLGNGSIAKGTGLTTLAGNMNYQVAEQMNPGNVAIGASPDTIILNSDVTYDSLTINPNDELITNGYNVTVNNNLTINGDLDATTQGGRNSTINVGGNWTNNSTFIPSTSTVNLNGGSGSTQVVSGNTNFYNLSATTNSVRTIQFTGGSTQTVTGVWTATGTSGHFISLTKKTGSSGVWNINPTSWNVNYVDVSDSTNQASVPIGPSHYSNTSLTANNTNWFTNQAPINYNVAVSTNGSGTVTPSGTVVVAGNTDKAFTLAPASHYHISNILLDNISQTITNSAGMNFTIYNLTDNHALSVTFSIDTNNITASSGANGSVSPEGVTAVNNGDNQTFSIVANTNFHIADVLVDGGSVGPVSSYNFTNVTAPHTIAATFSVDLPSQHTITAIVNGSGTVSPSGSVLVSNGADQSFTITPDSGYSLVELSIDGTSVGISNNYTFNDVITDHTIIATISPIGSAAPGGSTINHHYHIVASASSGGSISPSGDISIDSSSSKTFTITTDKGYYIDHVDVDGVSKDNISTYTFSSVSKDHSIEAFFGALPTSIDNPTDLVGTAGDSQITLSWVNPSTTYFSHIEIYRSIKAGDIGSQINSTEIGSTYTDSGLINGTTYYYTLKAVDTLGNISSGTPQLKLAPTNQIDDMAPTKPTGLRAESVKPTQINLIWNASTDNVGVTGYKLFNADTKIMIDSAQTNSYNLTKLTPGTVYSFFIQAYDAAGNISPQSDILAVTTGQGSQSAVQAHLILNNTPTQIDAGQTFGKNVKVTVVDAGGAPIRTYAGSVYFISSDQKASLTWNKLNQYRFAVADKGIHSFSGADFKLNTVGNQKLTVTDGSITQSVTVKVVASGSVISVQNDLKNMLTGLAGFKHLTNISVAMIATTAILLITPMLINMVLSAIDLWPQLFYILSNILQFLGLKRRPKPWGTVFDSQTGRPICYALVRIFDAEYNRLLEQTVTDQEGRFGFLVRSGRYYVTAGKSGYNFPSVSKDINFFDSVYIGGNLEAKGGNEVVMLNIPLDALSQNISGRKLLIFNIRIKKVLNSFKMIFLALGILFAIYMTATNYSLLYVLSLAFYILITILDLIKLKKIRPFGVVTDVSNRPLGTVIVRIYQEQTNRLIETDVTDASGRFKFLVSSGSYYLTADVPGYARFVSHRMLLTKEKTMVSVDIKMEKINGL
jgi:hypothetical protein